MMSLITRLRQKYGAQFLRFFIVGVGATLLHWGVYVALNRILGFTEEHPVALSCTYATGYIISFVANYIASLKWTFRTEGSVSKGLGFAFSHIVNFGMHMGLLNLFVLLGVGTLMADCLQYLAPWLVAMLPMLADPATLLPLPVFIIVVPINFLLVRFFLTRGDK